MVVYVDVLIVINLFVNYALLLCSSFILKGKTKNLRLLAGAMLGSLYGLVIFLPEIPVYIELSMRVAITFLIVIVAFGFKNLRRFLRCFFTFLAVTVAFGGIMFALWVTVAPIGMIYNNGTVYFDIDISVLAISTIACFTLVSIVSKIISRRAPTQMMYNLTICNSGKSISGIALCDTGNSLTENFSGYPVIIGEYNTLLSVLPKSVTDYYANPSMNNNVENLRIIVCKTVSDVSLLPAFRPEKVEITSLSKNVKTDEVYVAVTQNRIGGGEFDFILNPKIFDGVSTYENNRKNKKAFTTLKL